MSTEATVALITAGLALLGVVVTFLASARKGDFEILQGIIDTLSKRVEDLENINSDLEDWAERLVCQVKEAGLVPEKLIRHRREEKQQKTRPRGKAPDG